MYNITVTYHSTAFFLKCKELTRQKKRKKNEISAFFPLAVLHNRDKISYHLQFCLKYKRSKSLWQEVQQKN